ncbi:mechanosensitive ion channel family protein [Neisseria iguanae]|uniref:Mechanosensitive ion channel protein MscS n=1 Tax=Neisseria iguanae TaxID=90242 RepID=A0A2P7U193_9NEIS|nr:mechanosensitive ion channel domain-containing protein [Neisseria iguanae]PSJ80746.1 hypothetical protein C7N83_04450 [Neisseria iguanae]
MKETLHNLFGDLFAPQVFLAHLLEQNWNQPVLWIELACVAGLMVASLFASHYLIQRLLPLSVNENRHFLYHLGRRLIWPVLMLAIGLVAIFVCTLSGFHSIWLQLLILASRWMILIRIALAVVNAALPKNRLVDWLERVVSTALWIGFILWVSGIDDILIEGMQSVIIPIGSVKLNLYTITTGIIWIGIMLMLASWLARFISDRLLRSSLDTNLSMILSKVVKTLMAVLAVLIALPLVGIDLTVLSVFGGALGVGIGFGLQKIASNYISGFIILGDRSIRMNDRLTVNDFTGYVTQITSRFVVLKAPDGTEALIPNETFINSTVINESYTDKQLLQGLDIQVAYHSDLTRAMEILKETAAAQERVAQNPSPSSMLVDFADNGINLRVSFWVKDPENGFAMLRSAILMDIWKKFNENDIEFPFPQREVRILNEQQTPSSMAVLKAGLKVREAGTRSDPALDTQESKNNG